MTKKRSFPYNYQLKEVWSNKNSWSKWWACISRQVEWCSALSAIRQNKHSSFHLGPFHSSYHAPHGCKCVLAESLLRRNSPKQLQDSNWSSNFQFLRDLAHHFEPFLTRFFIINDIKKGCPFSALYEDSTSNNKRMSYWHYLIIRGVKQS